MYCHNGLVVVLGDFDAHLQGERYIKPTDDRGAYLLDLMIYHNLANLNTLPLCSGAAASFVHYDGKYESLIDHILFPVERLDTVMLCKVLDDHVLNVSRHRPVICRITVPLVNFEHQSQSCSSHVKWEKLDESVLKLYKSEVSNSLILYSCPADLDPKQKLEQKYTHIVNSIIEVSDSVLPKSQFKSYLKPYWDSNLKDLHAAMRGERRNWIRDGRPRGHNHISYREYKATKCLFPAYHRKCAEQFLTELDSDIDQAAELDSAVFWKKVNSRRNFSCTKAGSEIKFGNIICRDPESFASGWGVYFRGVIYRLR